MNSVMWEASATQRNLAVLAADGVQLLGPDSGDQACGETGPGRMQEPQTLVDAIVARLTAAPAGALAGRRVVITAGPTRESLDPVRFISNHSSGKQGYAFAEAARDAGAQVTLISGPVGLPAPPGVTLIKVTTALEMHQQSLSHGASCDLFVAVAAVADYRPSARAEQKIKKPAAGSASTLQIELIENPDIVASVASMDARPTLVIGFAAETENTREHAQQKMLRKNLDAIVVNDVSRSDIGFNSDDNAALLLFNDAHSELPKQSKYALAASVITQICVRFEAQLARTNPEHFAN
jgi:phosphopantothenoylcysteine decarboxylase/phosphopantothenate--cysteine ligase